MLLKRLEVQGFKTFAGKTEFLFDAGVTAIVGPNGSGKSNIADAVRWVLGEQSARPLRIKRSDDVIFAGSSARPRVGMAEVSMTLDNATKWLPIDFTDVTITRRAYRSGESEYLINKSRVRLRDVVEMLMAGNIGQNNYTVIGQGAIDAALSLRPEERRTLFEEAADIKRYQIKRNDALSKLEATDANLVRVRDLMAELAPRLQSLQTQAARAQEHERMLNELRGYLAAWYAHRWNEVSDGLRSAIGAESAAQATLEKSEQTLAGLAEQLAAVRQSENAQRSDLSAWHRELSGLHAQAEALERRLAVGRANVDAIGRQRQEVLAEIGPLRQQSEAQQQSAAAVESERAGLLAQQEQRRALLGGMEREAAELDARRRATQKQIETAENETVRAAGAIASAESTLGSLAGRRQALLDDIGRRQAQASQHEAASLSLQQTLAGLRSALTTQDGEQTALSAQRADAQTAIANARREDEAAQAAVNSAREERRVLELRLETMSRLHSNLTGYDAGVRAVLNTARSGALKGVVGTVASLVRVPPEYEAAIGAALGNHEQDIVMDSWQAAEAAVEHLRQTRSGRATFLPLDVVRGREPSDSIADGTWAAGVIGVDERYRQIVSYLLGRVLIVRDLSVARRILNVPAMRSVASIVTLAGDIVRPGGAITGGSPTVRSSGLLERERELSELPARISAAQANEQALEQKRAAAQGRVRQAEERLVALDGRLAGLRRQRDEQAALVAQRQREQERWQHELAWERDQEKSLRTALAALDTQEQKLHADLAVQRQRHAAAQEQAARLRQDMTSLVGSEQAARLAEARTAAALGEQQIRALQTLLETRRLEAARLAAQIAAKEKRAAELESELQATASASEAARTDLRGLSSAIAALQEKIAPAEAAVDSLEKQRSALLDQDVQARSRQATCERALSQAAMETQRARNELGRLQTQIEAEEGLGIAGLGLDDNEVKRMLDELAVPVQLSLATMDTRDSAASRTPSASPDVIKRRVDGLRSQMRHLGPINPNAVNEYDEALQRYSFLETQSDDLDRATKALKTVIAELDELMHKRFETTFDAVNRQFRHYFTTLFGGGSARLTLTNPDDLSETGVEIVAQPPGKRLQNLALLSGGERALTATALLFAIITANPTPFCVLDEVDAALDDANVGRFCDALRTLGENTQFIVITHNKGTMEMASSLYGVSMASDGTSQVLSLKLDDAAAQ